MQGVFWGLCAMDILKCKDRMPVGEIADWVMQCYHDDCGGFGGNVGHDAHMLYTQHAVYVLALCDALDRLDSDAVVRYIASLQQPDGSFAGDKWGEIDSRYTFCALVALAVLGRLHSGEVRVRAALERIAQDQNFDGGFGAGPGIESHAGYVFTSVGSLAVGGGMEIVPPEMWERLGWWLCERQCDSGGLNGRPEKRADVCYSWWVLSSLRVLRRMDWIDQSKLVEFILACQDPDTGGIGDQPDNVGDVFHTFFGICGLSLLGHFAAGEVNEVDPVFALPKYVLEQLGVPSPVPTFRN